MDNINMLVGSIPKEMQKEYEAFNLKAKYYMALVNKAQDKCAKALSVFDTTPTVAELSSITLWDRLINWLISIG